mgnify:CR=1
MLGVCGDVEGKMCIKLKIVLSTKL